MSETVKLIIEIPKEDYLNAKRINWANVRPEYVDGYEYQIAHGTPLDDVKAEICKAYKDFDGNNPLALSSFGIKVLEILDSIGKGE